MQLTRTTAVLSVSQVKDMIREVVVDINDLASVPKAQGTVSLVAGMVEAIQKFGFKVAGF